MLTDHKCDPTAMESVRSTRQMRGILVATLCAPNLTSMAHLRLLRSLYTMKRRRLILSCLFFVAHVWRRRIFRKVRVGCGGCGCPRFRRIICSSTQRSHGVIGTVMGPHRWIHQVCRATAEDEIDDCWIVACSLSIRASSESDVSEEGGVWLTNTQHNIDKALSAHV